MRRSLLLLLIVFGCRKATVEVRPDDKRSGPPRVTCKLVEPIATATVPARCDLTIDKVVQVHAGESLEIGAGAKVTFAKGAGLVLDGGTLKAKGTTEEPIVFTSATRVAGDWTGIVFRHRPYALSPKLAKPDAGTDAEPPPPNSESALEHVVIEFGGARAEGLPAYRKETAGLFVMPFVGDTVALSHVKLRNNAGYALWIDGEQAVTKLEAIDFDTGSVKVPIGLADVVSAAPAGTITLFGALEKSLVLPKRAYQFDRWTTVRSKGTAVTLEIEKGSTIRFPKGASVNFHGTSSSPVKLIANGVTFTSSEPTPAPGDWEHFSFGSDSAAEIDGSTFEYGGGSSKGSSGLIRLPFDESKMKLVNNTFRHITGAAFESNKDCKPWESPTLKNTSTGKLCEDGVFAKGFGAIGILGTLGSSGPSVSKIFGEGKFDDTAMIGVLGSEPGMGGLGSAGGGYGGGGLAGTGPGGGGSYGGIGIGSGGGSVDVGGPKSKVVESSITASGGLPADVVRKVVRGRIGSLRACHSSGSGTITVSFTIDENGGVTSAKVSGGSLTDSSTRSCVQGVFSGMSFPKPEAGGSTTATATHDYS